MFTTYLLILATSLALAGPQAQDARAEAERLAKSGDRAEALKRFQAIVAANPSDVAARIWIGRLHLEMGEPRRAAAVFESIVATEPQNVDALVGLGRALTEAGRTREASEVLSRAEALAADRLDVLMAQGKLHADAGRSTLALAYYARAAALEPANTEIQKAADTIRAARAHRFEADYDFQHFSTLHDDTHTGTFEVNLGLDDAFRVFAKGQTHRTFDSFDNRAGGGIEWLPVSSVWIQAGALFGNDTIELPELDVFGSVVHRGKRTRIGFDLRYADFDGADFWIGGPTLAFDLNDRATMYFEYHRGRAAFDVGDSATNDSVTVGFKSRIGTKASGLVEYRHGVDRLDWLTIDRLFVPDANTISFGLGYDVTPFVTLSGRYDYQSRPNDESVQRASAGFLFRF